MDDLSSGIIPVRWLFPPETFNESPVFRSGEYLTPALGAESQLSWRYLPSGQWEIQDQYFVGIFPETKAWKIGPYMVGPVGTCNLGSWNGHWSGTKKNGNWERPEMEGKQLWESIDWIRFSNIPKWNWSCWCANLHAENTNDLAVPFACKRQWTYSLPFFNHRLRDLV